MTVIVEGVHPNGEFARVIYYPDGMTPVPGWIRLSEMVIFADEDALPVLEE